MSPFVERAVVSHPAARRLLHRRDDDLAPRPSRVRRDARALRPTIGVVTVIGSDHLGIFRSAEAVAAQKGRLVEVPGRGRHGRAERGRSARSRHGAAHAGARRHVRPRRGRHAARDERGARWPERLSFAVHYEGRTAEVLTQLCGAHLVPNVLAALATGVALGIPLAEAVRRAVGTVPPFDFRLRPVEHPDGFTIVRDDYKAPLWSIPASFEFVRDATAKRKVIVLGTLSDYAGPSDRRTSASRSRRCRSPTGSSSWATHSAKVLKAGVGAATRSRRSTPPRPRPSTCTTGSRRATSCC